MKQLQPHCFWAPLPELPAKPLYILWSDICTLLNDSVAVAYANLKTVLERIWFLYFMDLSEILHQGNAFDRRDVPNAHRAHRISFLLCFVLTVIAHPATQRTCSSTSADPKICSLQVDSDFLLIGLFLSFVTAISRELYSRRVEYLEKRREELMVRLYELERRYNVWPLPFTRPVIVHMMQFDKHKMKVIETSSYMLLATMVLGAVHIGFVTQALLRVMIIHRSYAVLPNVLRLILVVNWCTLLDYMVRLPVFVRFQFLYCTTHFPPTTAPVIAA